MLLRQVLVRTLCDACQHQAWSPTCGCYCLSFTVCPLTRNLLCISSRLHRSRRAFWSRGLWSGSTSRPRPIPRGCAKYGMLVSALQHLVCTAGCPAIRELVTASSDLYTHLYASAIVFIHQFACTLGSERLTTGQPLRVLPPPDAQQWQAPLAFMHPSISF
jgi:hypothetical protein